MTMHIRSYEIPDGRSPGQPEVLVGKGAVDLLGMPEVDYDSLHQFMTDDLGIPYEDRTTVKLYGRWSGTGLYGFHIPYTRTIHVNAPASERRFASSGGTMRVVAHEGRHRSDSTNRKLVTAAEIAGRWASYKLGFEVMHYFPPLAPYAVFGALQTRGFYYKRIAPEEKRARAQEVHASTMEHQRDILFPNSGRTYMLNAIRDFQEELDL